MTAACRTAGSPIDLPNQETRDPDFPNLPFIPDEVRCWWSEEEKWARHLLEVEANAVVFNARMRSGMTPIEAALLPLPKPWMDRHTLTELLAMREQAKAKRAAP
jgi:hypothetical protein